MVPSGASTPRCPGARSSSCAFSRCRRGGDAQEGLDRPDVHYYSSMTGKLGHISRVAAAIISVVWACAGIVGLVAAYAYGRWVLALASLFALGYATLWAHVVARARLLTWKEIAAPWRARSRRKADTR